MGIIDGNNSSCMDIVVPQHVSTWAENSDMNTTTTNDTNLEEEEEEEKNKDNSFILYHYNGLEGGILSTFRIIPFPSENETTEQQEGSSSCYTRDLEDVIRTKWPTCKYDWSLNKSNIKNTVRSLID